MGLYTLGLFANSYPADENDWRGIFIRRMVNDLESHNVTVKKAVKKSARISGYVRFYLDCLMLARQTDIDVLQAEYIPHSGIIPVLLKKKRPLVLKFHGDDARIFPFKNMINKKITQTMIKRSDHILTSSEEIRQILIKLGANPEISSTIHSGVDTEFFRPLNKRQCRKRLNIETDSIIFLFVGRLHSWKGINEIIEAARTFPDYKFLLVGPGNPPQHPNNCIFFGSVPTSEIRFWMNSADCILLPTYTEAIPTVILESSACGIPAITSDVGGCPEIVSHRDNGLLIPARNVEALINAIEWMAKHPDEREKMGRRGREIVVERYDHEKMVKKLIKVHLGLLEKSDNI